MNKKYLLTMTGLWTALFSLIFLMIFLTIKGVSISVVPPDKYALENVKYIGVGESSCYKTSCTAKLKFQDGDNTYQLTGHRHEVETLVVDSYYNIYYDDYSKEIKSYTFSQKQN